MRYCIFQIILKIYKLYISETRTGQREELPASKIFLILKPELPTG